MQQRAISAESKDTVSQRFPALLTANSLPYNFPEDFLSSRDEDGHAALLLRSDC